MTGELYPASHLTTFDMPRPPWAESPPQRRAQVQTRRASSAFSLRFTTSAVEEFRTMPGQNRFDGELTTALNRMAREPRRDVVWPSGCYGSLGSWLVFIGPSPGGGRRNAPDAPRNPAECVPLWNEDFTEPFAAWSNGFRTSLQTFIEQISGLPLAQGSARLYAFLNFDWIENPDAANVPAMRMEQGAPDVLRILEEIRPRVIVALENRSHLLLDRTLRDAGYRPNDPEFGDVFIAIRGTASHKSMDAFTIEGAGVLAGSYVIRSPQHPARIFDGEYAARCARAIRSVLEQMVENVGTVTVHEA